MKQRQAKAGGIITQLKRTLEIKEKKKEFTTKKYDKNITLINTKLDKNEICFNFLNYYMGNKEYLFCECKAFGVILCLQIVLALKRRSQIYLLI